MTVIATAGHVDHGKSTLVRALTGVDPDRWAEEKARGLTIDLGFAAMAPGPDGSRVEFVDVPGHTRFLRNMLAGVGAISRCLFVVAADDGWKPQSEEHLRILQVLGVTAGVIALTKVDRVDPETIEIARTEIADAVVGTFLQDAPVLATDATSGLGIDELRGALIDLAGRPARSPVPPRFRLWIDRSFAAQGAGTVVTGTLTGGSLARDDRVVVAPGRRHARIRALQHHGEDVESIGPDHRVAVNLSGIAHTDVIRGDALVAGDAWHHTDVFDASLAVLDRLGHSVSRRGSHVCYVGSGEFPARLRVLGPSALDPGQQGFVRVRLDHPLPLQPGDRFVLRDYGRDETVGGGEVLDVEPALPASRALPDRSVARLVAERGVVEASHLELLCGFPVTPDLGPFVVDPALREVWSRDLRDALETAGPDGVTLAALDEPRRLLMATLEGVVLADGVARVDGATDHERVSDVLAALDSSPFAPPEIDPASRGVVNDLKRAGLAVEHDGIIFSADAIALASAVVADLLARHPEGFSVAQARTAWGNTRKHAVPLLEILDSRGVTRRRDDKRLAGPRLPAR